MASSYGGYCVAINSRELSNTEPMPSRVANCCIVASRGSQSQSARDPRDELLVKNISARDNSNTLVVPPTVDNEIAYSTHYCRFPSFESRTVKQLGTRRTVARALDAPAAKPLSIHDLCAKPLTTDVICTSDSATSRAAPRTESHSALDLTPTRLVSCAHRKVLEGSLAKIAQFDTRAKARDAYEYNSSRTSRTRDLILNLQSSLLYRRRISRLVSCDCSSPMSALLDRFDAAEIFALASVDAISLDDARNQLQSHIAVDVMIEGLDQRFTDSIMTEGCATPRLLLERTLARLSPMLGGLLRRDDCLRRAANPLLETVTRRHVGCCSRVVFSRSLVLRCTSSCGDV